MTTKNSATPSTAALSVQFCNEKLVRGAASELVLGRTDLMIPGEKKNYGPYTVVKLVSAVNGNGAVTAIIMRTTRIDATAPAKAASEQSQARVDALEAKLDAVLNLLASQHVSDNAIKPPTGKKSRKVSAV